MKRIIKSLLVVLVLPLALLAVLLKRTGLINYVSNKIAVRKATKELRKIHRNSSINSVVLNKIQCKNVVVYQQIFLGNVAGYYEEGKIVVSNRNVGLMLADTLFHEDRHYQQELANVDFSGYIQPKEDLISYHRQHVEKDARRHAYVQVCKSFSDDGKIGFYKFMFHPWKGVIPKVVTLEGYARRIITHIKGA